MASNSINVYHFLLSTNNFCHSNLRLNIVTVLTKCKCVKWGKAETIEQQSKQDNGLDNFFFCRRRRACLVSKIFVCIKFNVIVMPNDNDNVCNYNKTMQRIIWVLLLQWLLSFTIIFHYMIIIISSAVNIVTYII